MLFENLEKLVPVSWDPMNIYLERYKIVSMHPSTQEFHDVLAKIQGLNYTHIQGVYRIQNPMIFAKFKIKENEYATRGIYNIMTLFHDTARVNMESIALYNIDWRFGERFKFGPGVYFSQYPNLANKHSTRKNGVLRSMFIVDVLIQKVQICDNEVFLPDYGYDTVLCHRGETYVKYFDCEYYPQYCINYISPI